MPSAIWKSTGLGSSENENLNKTLCDVYEFQCILRAHCVLVPSDVLVKIFRLASSKFEISGVDCFNSFTFDEINEVLHGLIGDAESILLKALTGVILDLPSVMYFLAGLLLLIGSFATTSEQVGSIVFSFFPNAMYLISASITVAGMPAKDWSNMETVYSNICRWRASMRIKAAAHHGAYDCRSNNEPPNPRDRRSRTSQFVNQLRYIQDIVYSNSTSEALTKSEVEMLLLQQLGTAYTSRTLDHIVSVASHSNVRIEVYIIFAVIAIELASE